MSSERGVVKSDPGYVNRMKAKYTAKWGVHSQEEGKACGRIPYEPIRLRE